MSLHQLLPLVACLLNLTLAALAVGRNPKSRPSRAFAAYALSMALWNVGALMLRLARNAGSAYGAEIVLHAGVIALVPFAYHFVLEFLDVTVRSRISLVAVYVLALGFLQGLPGSCLHLRRGF